MNEHVILENAVPLPRSKRLKAATNGTHDRLDQSIMSAKPFENRERYGLFVKVQHGFHRDIDALYDNATLDALLPDLQGRRRFGLVTQDLADLGQVAAPYDISPAFSAGGAVDLPTALGWLYVAEGSSLGAAFLIKEAQKIGLSDEFGARHLAGAPEGRGLHWRTFTTALDSIELDPDAEARVVAGSEAAFQRVRALVHDMFGRDA